MVNQTQLCELLSLQPGQEGAIVRVGQRIGGARHSGQRATPEIVLAEDGLGLVLRNSLHLIAPLPGQLVGRLSALDTCRDVSK